MNDNLHKARDVKNDEFYTQRADIENELRHYKEQFKGKIVFCNCDDPDESEFFKYFAMRFNSLGLKKLITTHYSGNEKPSYKIELTGVTDVNGDGAIDLADVEHILANTDAKTLLKGNGDFRSPECIELLKEADVVVTNPPFSLFREFVDQLIRWEKQFLIIGNKNAITYKSMFKLIKDNRLWLGYSTPANFVLPDGTLANLSGLTRWFTNLYVSHRHKPLSLYAFYSSDEHPHYDNYDAIDVSKVVDIPKDWTGVMGVPITFLDKYNPEQFRIIKFRKGDDERDLVVDGKSPYFRVLIQRIGDT